MSNPHPYGQHQPTGFQPPSNPGQAPAQPSAPSQSSTTYGKAQQQPSPTRPRRIPLIAVAGAAALALLISVVAAGLAWNANSKATQALDKVSAQPAATIATPQATTAEPAQTDTTGADPAPTDTATGAVPELNAQTRYEVKYTDQALRISAGANCTSVAIDFDEPRVGADDIRKDLGFDRPCTSQGERIELADGVQGSLADSASVQPADCADQIRTSPLAAGSQPIRTGQVYCLNTSLDAARSQAITWKMVVLTVSAIAQDGTVSFKVTAWDIPV